MCKPCMFSYWPGVWQTCGAKRRERRLNGAALSLSGDRLTAALPLRSLASPTRDSRGACLHVILIELIHSLNWTCKVSSFTMKTLRNRLCSRFREGYFVCSPVAACKSSAPVDLPKNLSPRRPVLLGQCALQTCSSRKSKRRFHDLDS